MTFDCHCDAGDEWEKKEKASVETEEKIARTQKERYSEEEESADSKGPLLPKNI